MKRIVTLFQEFFIMYYEVQNVVIYAITMNLMLE